MIQIERYVDTTLDKPNIITSKKGKYLLGKFLMEQGLLQEFTRCFKYFEKCTNRGESNIVDKLTYNEILNTCIKRLKESNLPFCEIFNYDYVSISWWIPASKIDWFNVHVKWNDIIEKDIYIDEYNKSKEL